MDDNRKRAGAACDRCRRRKRRCDGEVPTCSVCDKAGVDCTYTHNDSRRSTQTPTELVERLSSLEALLEEQAACIEHLKSTQQQPPQQVSPNYFPGSVTSPVGLADLPSVSQNHGAASHATPSLSFDVEAPPMLIPRGHSTTTDSLLASDQVKALLGQFPNGMFLLKEVKRGWPLQIPFYPGLFPQEELPRIVQLETQHLVEAYFSLAHEECPILDRGSFYNLYSTTLISGLRFDAESALCLVVLAIGSVVTEQSCLSEERAEDSEPGLEYISSALRILVPDAFRSFESTVAVPQALLLAAKYFGYLLRPLQSWKLVSMASTSIQHLCSVAFGPKNGVQQISPISLTAWAVFDTECDLIAEHQLPHSGIGHLMENMPFPSFDDHNESNPFLLAELSVRKLLNRVHYTLYDDAEPTFVQLPALPSSDNQIFRRRSVTQVLSVSRELDRQLETWFQMLPQSIKPDLCDPSSWGAHQLSLLQRYHSGKDIIFRPFVLYACATPESQDLPLLLIEQCDICLQSCRLYIQCSGQRLGQVCSNREVIIHSLLACTIVLTLAALCRRLRHLVPDIQTLQTEVIQLVGRWVKPGSLVEDISEILKLLRSKTSLLGP